MKQIEEDDARFEQEQREQQRALELELLRLESKCLTGMIDWKGPQ